MYIFDTHSHLTMDEYKDDLPQVIDRMFGMKIATLSVGYDLESSQKSILLAKTYINIFAAVGVHPHDGSKVDEGVLEKIEHLCNEAEVVALGEIGLDFHYNLSSKEAQLDAFSKQLSLAKKKDMPVIIHCRDAWEDTFAIINDFPKIKGVFHCFTGNEEHLKKVLDKGFYVSFGGMITFPKAEGIRDLFKQTPIDRLLLETDCPYMAPVPHRGKRNEPGYIKYVVEKAQELTGKTEEEIIEATTINAEKLFFNGQSRQEIFY